MSKFFYLIGIILVCMSCGKDIDLFIPRENQGEQGDVARLKSRLLEEFAPEITYVFQVPCSGNVTFPVDKDVVISIPKDFADQALYPCTDGYYDFYVTVCDTKGEILVAGIPTISEGKLLESRIEINLNIKHGDVNVKLAHGKQITVRVNDPDPRDRMELFYGNDQNSSWLQADNDPNAWDNVANAEWNFQDSTGQLITGFGYESFCDSLDWINVDVFTQIEEDQRTDVCIELPDEFTNTNTSVFMVFDDYRSIVNLVGNADVKKFCEPYGLTPKGFNVTFVVISEMGEGSYMFAKKSTTITEHHYESLTPVNTPYSEIKDFLHEL